MQSSAVAAAAVVLLLCGVVPAASTALGESAARNWLYRHPQPQGDELAELKDQNPEAYAIVKALLTKRALGLLDPKHPTASFAAPPLAGADDGEASGPMSYQVSAAPGDREAFGPAVSQSPASMAAPQAAPVSYPEVAAPAHHNFLNWRPQQSALDDEAMVKSVLGAVAELKGAKPLAKVSPDSEDAGHAAPQASEARPSAGDASVAPDGNAQKLAEARAPEPASQETSDLKGVNFGVEAPPEASQPASQDPIDGSYLRGLGSREGPRPKGRSPPEQTSYLASFSWDDEPRAEGQSGASKAEPEGGEPQPSASAGSSPGEAPQPAQHKNALLAWLGR